VKMEICSSLKLWLNLVPKL